MNNTQKRFLLFLFGCMGTRTFFLFIAKQASPLVLFYMGWLALVPAFGFMYYFLTGSRKTGGEVFGEKIWWNDLRPVHSVLYALFAWKAITGQRGAWVYLLIDILVGIFSFLGFHYWNDDFKQLMNVGV